ncbi:MAG: pentapeptide repeat-containing protein [Rothia mucilaginosa]|nr:pentapeptide repeat-containing protein [Rothia mucilaginosa]
MLEGERSYQRGQENLVPSNNTSSAPENPVAPKAQENPWYIRHFTKLLIGFGLGGGAVAILLPWMLWLLCGMSSGSSDQLRLHLLYITGGIIAVLTLLQTNWKNQGDRLKIDADIKKNEQDAEKNERDHIRQVHAERRSRYTKAVEQLAEEKATVRLGGIYTLVGLVDEWLADDTLEAEEQQKEGQVIINNLCSYIRSPFPLALKAEVFESDIEPTNYEGNFSKDQAAFREEQDVRRTIFVEMSKRSSEAILDDYGKLIEIIPGTWSNFDVNFSRAPVFYPLNNLTIEKADFSGTKFYTDAKFFNSDFIGTANFNEAVFTNTADFSTTAFTDTVHFNETIFANTAEFNGAIFTGDAFFAGATFTKNADFGSSSFTRSEPIFAIFMSDIGLWRARFSAHANSKDYIFETYPKSTHSFACGTAELLNKTFILPLDAVLYDPDSWDEEKQDYTRLSEPAQ